MVNVDKDFRYPVCPKCGKPMELKEVLVVRTTSPEDDDVWETAWICECGHLEPNIRGDEDDE